MRKLSIILLSLLLLAGCSQNVQQPAEDTTVVVEQPSQTETTPDEINLTGNVKEQVVVNSTGDVVITLKDVTADMNKSFISVESANSVTVILEGTNTIKVSGADIKAIDSRDDLIFKGTGTLNIEAQDTCIKSNDDLTIESGTFNLSSSEGDCLRANETLTINGGSFILKGSEGIESTEVVINDGDIQIFATDDAINASEKSSKNLTPKIEINGGNVDIEMSQGDTDAIDSNGYIYINGGNVNINAQFAFDFALGAELNGGNVTVNGQKVTQISNSMMAGGFGFNNQGQPQMPQDGQFGQFGQMGPHQGERPQHSGYGMPQDGGFPMNPQGQTTEITEDIAKQIALNHAGVSESEISNYNISKEVDGTQNEYDIDFTVGNTEYDYHISIETGKILEFDVDRH